MNRSQSWFPTTVIGSLPRPPFVKDLFQSGSRINGKDARWQQRMDDIVRFAVRLQEQAGIDIISDGEWRRETYVDVIAEILNGFDWIDRTEFGYHQVVVRQIEPNKPGIVAEEARVLRHNTKQKGKICLPSP